MSKPIKHLLYYAVTIGLSFVLLLAILKAGPNGPVTAAQGDLGLLQGIQHELARNLSTPLAGLLIQVFVILAFCRLCAVAFGYLGQPRVVGEMIAGIILGKSVFGLLWPEGFAATFPDSSMPRLFFLSQVGLIFFMFVVGLDLKVSELKSRASAALLISHSSIIFPFLLGALASLGIYESYGPANFSFASFALFMGIAMSITAFPVLARIIQEKGMTDTPLGAMALTCAAIDDVTAWCVLAAVLGIVKAGTASTAIGVLVISIVYVTFMFKVARPFLAKALRPSTIGGGFSHAQLALVFFSVIASALTTEIIGIHALFGAFLAGTIMPQSPAFRAGLIERIEDLCLIVLLPIFFAYTGLRMQVALLDTWNAWFVCGGITVLAIVGKLLGSALAARWSGMSWRDSWALGTLMNTRGLMELVVLNIGYDIGILSPAIFSMLVVMAVLTTAMTGVVLPMLLPELRGRKETVRSAAVPGASPNFP